MNKYHYVLSAVTRTGSMEQVSLDVVVFAPSAQQAEAQAPDLCKYAFPEKDGWHDHSWENKGLLMGEDEQRNMIASMIDAIGDGVVESTGGLKIFLRQGIFDNIIKRLQEEI